ncbi:hypothetical protein [Paenibacillus medicaginis]|uniref:DUF2564 family protein n=1 Tax=Paenibacillus medicaginis TaxID=1470560 RepID=A0ABV5BUV5_9BACL
MNRTVGKEIDAWSKGINNMFDRQKEIDEKLSPSRLEMKCVADYARSIDQKVQLMNNASQMAHDRIIDFESAQKIIDMQKKSIKRDIKYLQGLLEDEAAEE